MSSLNRIFGRRSETKAKAIEPVPPPPDWYCRFGTRKLGYRDAGGFFVDWMNRRWSTTYISLVHRDEESEQVIERIRAVAFANGGGERRIVSGGATYHFYGRVRPIPDRLASVRIDQRPLHQCSFGLVSKLAVHGDSVTTFQIGRSFQGRLFGLYCALSSWNSHMALATGDPLRGFARRAVYRFGNYNIGGRDFNVVRNEIRYYIPTGRESQSLMLEYFNLPRSICLQFMEHYREERFFDEESVRSLRNFVDHMWGNL